MVYKPSRRLKRLCVCLPLVLITAGLLVPLLGYDAWQKYMMSERWGLAENGTVAFLLTGIILAGMAISRRGAYPRGLTVFLALFMLVSFYFAGEEASWGQHWLGFKTPDSISKINKQHEFNLHNLQGARKYFNAEPKRLLVVAIIAGGIVAPLVMIRWRRQISEKLAIVDWIIPPPVFAIAATLAICSDFPEEILDDRFHLSKTFHKTSYLNMALLAPAEEFREFMIGMLFFLYALMIYCRTRQQTPQAQLRAS